MIRLITFRLAVLLFALPWALVGDSLKIVGIMLSTIGDAFTGWFSSMFLGKSLQDLLIIRNQRAEPDEAMLKMMEDLKASEEQQRCTPCRQDDGSNEGTSREDS